MAWLKQMDVTSETDRCIIPDIPADAPLQSVHRYRHHLKQLHQITFESVENIIGSEFPNSKLAGWLKVFREHLELAEDAVGCTEELRVEAIDTMCGTYVPSSKPTVELVGMLRCVCRLADR